MCLDALAQLESMEVGELILTRSRTGAHTPHQATLREKLQALTDANAVLHMQLSQHCAVLVAAGFAEQDVLTCLGGDPASDALLRDAMDEYADSSMSSECWHL